MTSGNVSMTRKLFTIKVNTVGPWKYIVFKKVSRGWGDQWMPGPPHKCRSTMEVD